MSPQLARTEFAPGAHGYPNAAKAVLEAFDAHFAAPKYPFMLPGVCAGYAVASAFAAPEVSKLDYYRRTMLAIYSAPIVPIRQTCMQYPEQQRGDVHSGYFITRCDLHNMLVTNEAGPVVVALGDLGASIVSFENLKLADFGTMRSEALDPTGVSIVFLSGGEAPRALSAPEIPAQSDEERLRTDVIMAVKFIARMLSASETRVAEALGMSPTSFANWRAGRIPRPSSAAKVVGLRSLLRSLARRLGVEGARDWLAAGVPPRREKMLEGDIADVRRQIDDQVFPSPPAPSGGYAPDTELEVRRSTREPVRGTVRTPVRVHVRDHDQRPSSE